MLLVVSIIEAVVKHIRREQTASTPLVSKLQLPSTLLVVGKIVEGAFKAHSSTCLFFFLLCVSLCTYIVIFRLLPERSKGANGVDFKPASGAACSDGIRLGGHLTNCILSTNVEVRAQTQIHQRCYLVGLHLRVKYLQYTFYFY